MNTIRVFLLFFLLVIFSLFVHTSKENISLEESSPNILSFIPPGAKILGAKDQGVEFISKKSLSETYGWYEDYGKHLDLLSAEGFGTDGNRELNFVFQDNTSLTIKLGQSKTTNVINGVVTRKTP